VAINPPSDIVLGAVLAADPAKYQAAVERLRRASGDAGAPDTDFQTAISELQDWQTSITREAMPASAQSVPPAASTARASGASKPPEAFAQLEAFVLQSFIQSMLPQNSQGFFGKGPAGEVWKSMLAEKLGAQIASSGQVGLAKRLAMGRTPSVLGISPATAALAGGPRMSPALMTVLPYMSRSASAADLLAVEGASTTERS
jgi:Rod binding domain-containing protein